MRRSALLAGSTLVVVLRRVFCVACGVIEPRDFAGTRALQIAVPER